MHGEGKSPLMGPGLSWFLRDSTRAATNPSACRAGSTGGHSPRGAWVKGSWRDPGGLSGLAPAFGTGRDPGDLGSTCHMGKLRLRVFGNLSKVQLRDSEEPSHSKIGLLDCFL